MKLNSNLVLCVDDEVVGLQVRKILLERAGYRVLTASDGPSGLEIFSSEPVEAVVLDYSMPGMHGGEVAVRMRQAKPQVPILLLSAYMGLSARGDLSGGSVYDQGGGCARAARKIGQPASASKCIPRVKATLRGERL